MIEYTNKICSHQETVMNIFVVVWLCTYSFCIYPLETPPPALSITIDNSTRQEIGTSSCRICRAKYGSKRIRCMLSLSPDAMWEQFLQFEGHERADFLYKMPLEHYDTFLQRIVPEQWDAWYYSLPHAEQHQLVGTYAHQKKIVQNARTHGSMLTHSLLEPVGIGIAALFIPLYAVILAAGCELFVRSSCAEDPLEKKIQERLFEVYKKQRV